MRVLLSIKPPHVASILAGRKKFEFRRQIFTRTGIDTVVVYCTRPISRLIGEFKINRIIEDRPDVVWNKTQEWSGISRDYYYAYFQERRRAFAIEIGAVKIFRDEIDPRTFIDKFCPPQSFMYIDSHVAHNLDKLAGDPLRL